MTTNPTQPIAAVFPGQGSQRPGMAQDFYDEYPAVKQIFDQTSEALDLDMAELCFTENEQVNQTEFTQPAILTVEAAMFAVLKSEYGFNPSYYAGHSLGEYSALVAAGVLPVTVAAKIVRKRGALMQQAVPIGTGAMAAVIGDQATAADVGELIHKHDIETANINSPTQIVVSGKAAGVKDFVAECGEKYPELRLVELNVSAPFHSGLMKPIEAEFRNFLALHADDIDAAKSKYVLSNYAGGFHRPSDLEDNLVRQISGSVEWVQNMHILRAVSSGGIFEVGPNKVLKGFFASLPTPAEAEVKSIINIRSARKALGEPSSV